MYKNVNVLFVAVQRSPISDTDTANMQIRT